MAFNILYWDSADASIKRATTAQLDQLAEFILETMAAGTYAGTLAVGGSSGTAIGTFTDRYRSGVVGNRDTTLLETTYTIRQINSTQSGTVNPPNYLGYEASGNDRVIRESATTLNQLADEIISRMVSSEYPNSYQLSVGAPSGGTWVSRGNLVDTRRQQFFNPYQTVSDYALWHKVSSSTYTSRGIRLLKRDGSEIVEWTDTEISRLIKTVEDRIIATGIGTYSLGTTAPSTGTWVSKGSATDTYKGTTDTNYIRTQDETILENYLRDISYAGNYVRGKFTYTGNYVGTATFTGNYLGSYEGPAYTATTVSNTNITGTTVTLWRRIA